MLIDIRRTTASICPKCANAPISNISVFDLSGNRSFKIYCPIKSCHQELVSIAPKGDKYKVSVECPYCGCTHTHTVSRDSFWKKELLLFPCPEFAAPSFFAGERKNVEAALNETLCAYSKQHEEMLSNLENFEDGYDIDGPDILYDIAEVIYELRDSGAVSCVCGSEVIAISTVGSKVLLSCPRCRRSKVIEASVENLAMVINATAIVLGR